MAAVLWLPCYASRVMPELPEVEVTRLGVQSQFAGQRLTAVQVRQPQLRKPVPVKALTDLAGEVLTGTSRRSKYLLLQFESAQVMVHLGMSGALRVVPADSPWQLHEHVQMRFGDKALRLHDPRRFGSVDVIAASENLNAHASIRSLGVEPLTEDFTPDTLYRASRGRKQNCKSFLLAGQAVVGVGNIYASESLFRAGIRPGRAAGRLTRQDCQRLHQAVVQVLSEAVAAGGSSLRDFSAVDGELGHFQTRAFVYDREGQPCKRCAGTIRRQVHGQRSSFVCFCCQPR